MTRGIKEWLRRWLWELPDDVEPVRIGHCRRCGEQVLVTQDEQGRQQELERDGHLHQRHPRTVSPAPEYVSTLEDAETEQAIRARRARTENRY